MRESLPMKVSKLMKKKKYFVMGKETKTKALRYEEN
jgi:hypothetical protein